MSESLIPFAAGSIPTPYPAVTLARQAMATRFEVVLPGTKTSALRAAGEEALDEVERWEGMLSLYRSSSEIAEVNANALHQPVRVSPPVFGLLKLAKQLHQETGGAFDISVAPLIRCWGFMSGKGALPASADIEEAKAKVGMDCVELNEEENTVRFHRDGMMLDLGGIGKGFAIDRAVEILRDAGITDALIHGGTSSIYAWGRPPDQDSWRISIEARSLDHESVPIPLAFVSLNDESLSVSAVWGKMFKAGPRTFGHIIDPRTGYPTDNALMAAIILPSATEADALTTALLIDGKTCHNRLVPLRPNMKALVVAEADEPHHLWRVACHNIELLADAPVVRM